MTFMNLKSGSKTLQLLYGLGLVTILYLIYLYSTKKFNSSDGYSKNNNNKNKQPLTKNSFAGESAIQSAGDGEYVGSNQNDLRDSNERVSSQQSSYNSPSCTKGKINDPSELLPRDANSQWAKLNPSGGVDFNKVNLLKAGYNIGIDTVGSSMRNANLQTRSEPPNPTAVVSPWMNTSIEPNLLHAPLEIGCGPVICGN
jgi:hypothetical protein